MRGSGDLYVADIRPTSTRPLTAWIRTTASASVFFLSLFVILACRQIARHRSLRSLGLAAAPFCASIALLIVSVYVRLPIQEIAVFPRKSGMRASCPRRRARGSSDAGRSADRAARAARRGRAGQAVGLVRGQVLCAFFLKKILKVDATAANLRRRGGVLLIGTPFSSCSVRFRPDRAQNRHRWLPAHGADLLPLFKHADLLRRVSARCRRRAGFPSPSSRSAGSTRPVGSSQAQGLQAARMTSPSQALAHARRFFLDGAAPLDNQPAESDFGSDEIELPQVIAFRWRVSQQGGDSEVRPSILEEDAMTLSWQPAIPRREPGAGWITRCSSPSARSGQIYVTMVLGPIAASLVDFPAGFARLDVAALSHRRSARFGRLPPSPPRDQVTDDREYVYAGLSVSDSYCRRRDN